MSSMAQSASDSFRSCCFSPLRRRRRRPRLSAAQRPVAAAPANVGQAFADWRRLRQSSGYSFAEYARFLIYNPGWPGEDDASPLGRKGDAPGREYRDRPRLLPDREADDRQRLGALCRCACRQRPRRRSGRRRQGSLGLGRPCAPTTPPTCSPASARYLTPQEHNRRVDALLFAKKPASAAPLLAWTTPGPPGGVRRPRRDAVALARRRDAAIRAVAHRIGGDAGPDDGPAPLPARRRQRADRRATLAAQPHNFTHRPADASAGTRCCCCSPTARSESRQFTHAYNIARQLDDALPPGTDMAKQPLGVRDDYTSLAWLAGRNALDRLNSPANAVGDVRPLRPRRQVAAGADQGPLLGRRAPRLRPASRPPPTPICRAPAATPTCSTASWRSSGSAAPVPQPAALPTVAATDTARRTMPGNRLLAAARYAIATAARSSRRCSSARSPNR